MWNRQRRPKFKYGNFGLSPSMSILDFKNSRSTYFFSGGVSKPSQDFKQHPTGRVDEFLQMIFLGLLKDATVGPSMHRISVSMDKNAGASVDFRCRFFMRRLEIFFVEVFIFV